MLNKKTIDVVQALEKINGVALNGIGRAGNMVWVGLGDNVQYKTWRGEIKTAAKYSIHIQTCFRITCNGKIILGSSDIYEPSNHETTLLDFDWDTYGANRYDKIAEEFTRNYHGKLVVENVYINEIGDLKIEFSDHYVFEILMNGSAEAEMWRFFESGSDKAHIVMTGRGLEFE